MRITITGAEGFLGGYLADAVRSALPDARVTGIVLDQPALPVAGVEYTRRLPDGDVMFHLAGGGGIPRSLDDPRGDLERHAGLVLDYLEACRRGAARTFVLASSAAVYGPVEGEADEDGPLRPATPYGVSKLAAEHYVRIYRDLHGLDGRVARIGNAYGCGQRQLAVYDLALRAVSEGPPLRIRGNGTEVRDFIHARDIARALVLIGLGGEPGGVYNVGAGEPVDLFHLARLVARAAGLPPDIAPDSAATPGKVQFFCPSVSRLRALGFKPSVPLAEGVADVVAWVREEARR